MLFVFLLAAIPRLIHPKSEMMSSAELLLAAIHASWPPHNPAHSSDDSNNTLISLGSPWTYENGSLNPILEPSNAHLRSVKKRKRQVQSQDPGKSSLPPYHPDYDGADVMHTSDDGESTSEDNEDTTPFVRGGSEGYEVHSVDREEMLRRYLMEVGQEPGRYHRYIPSPDSDSNEEHLPLGQVLKDS
jgi:palmitoyltransferase